MAEQRIVPAWYLIYILFFELKRTHPISIYINVRKSFTLDHQLSISQSNNRLFGHTGRAGTLGWCCLIKLVENSLFPGLAPLQFARLSAVIILFYLLLFYVCDFFYSDPPLGSGSHRESHDPCPGQSARSVGRKNIFKFIEIKKALLLLLQHPELKNNGKQGHQYWTCGRANFKTW